jgi:hypothetical protein
VEGQDKLEEESLDLIQVEGQIDRAIDLRT